mmetsp:Transcript_434/g.1212  ORF Transcript_434/g.1212 Transcript_434/m.1212 type:complete len:432 (+) Transcript_434:74-1369(+)
MATLASMQAMEQLGKLGMPMSVPLARSEEGSTSDGSEGTYALPDVGRSMSVEEVAEAAMTSPAPWTIPFPASTGVFQDANTMSPQARVPQAYPGGNMQDPGAKQMPQLPQMPHLTGLRPVAPGGFMSDGMAKQWLQNEVAELAELMSQREAEMSMLQHQLSALTAFNTAVLPQPMMNQGGGLEMQIQLLQKQLDQLTRLVSMPKGEPMSPTFSPTSPAAFTTPSDSPEEGNVLTVMMRNLPNKYTQKMLIEEVNYSGFQGTYDFLYLPIDKESGANKGYAFLNFLRPDYAYGFKLAFHGKQMAQFKSNKIVNVTPAAIQGFEANHAHFSRTRVNYGDPDARPLFLRKVGQKGNQMQTNSTLTASPPGLSGQDSARFQLPGGANVPSGVLPAWSADKAAALFCASCGTRRSPHHQFCEGCGRKFEFEFTLRN